MEINMIFNKSLHWGNIIWKKKSRYSTVPQVDDLWRIKDKCLKGKIISPNDVEETGKWKIMPEDLRKIYKKPQRTMTVFSPFLCLGGFLPHSHEKYSLYYHPMVYLLINRLIEACNKITQAERCFGLWTWHLYTLRAREGIRGKTRISYVKYGGNH